MIHLLFLGDEAKFLLHVADHVVEFQVHHLLPLLLLEQLLLSFLQSQLVLSRLHLPHYLRQLLPHLYLLLLLLLIQSLSLLLILLLESLQIKLLDLLDGRVVLLLQYL